MLTKYAIRGGALLAILYLINMIVAPMAQGFVAVIPIDLGSIFSVFVTLVIASAALDYAEKNLLKKYM